MTLAQHERVDDPTLALSLSTRGFLSNPSSPRTVRFVRSTRRRIPVFSTTRRAISFLCFSAALAVFTNTLFPGAAYAQGLMEVATGAVELDLAQSVAQVRLVGRSRRLQRPHGVFVDPKGNIYIGDSSNHRVRKVVVD